MKKVYMLIGLMLSMGISSGIIAQTDPGTSSLTHQWTFDDGTATDQVGGVTGTIHGDGKLANNAFISTNAYMDFPAAQIGINAYTGLTTEIWCTSSEGKNTGWTMLSYFGATTSGAGNNYTFVSIARMDNVSMVSLGTGAYWDGCTGPEYDDGKLHHFVCTVNATTISFYIDGNLISSDPLTAGNTLASVSNSLAYLGRGGWSGDPNWVGTFHKFSIYNKALSTDEVLYLYQHGAEAKAVINATTTNIALDGNYPAETFKISGQNLVAPITLTAPAGITLMNSAGNTISSLPATATDESVAVVWNTTKPVNGNIVLTSGSTVVKIPVKTIDDTNCFSQTYPNLINLVTDPGMNNLSYFGGWGSRSVVNIINDSAKVYCGASSMAIGNGTAGSSGSVNVLVTGILQPNTTYLVKAKVKTMDGNFQLGVYNWATGGVPDVTKTVNTNGEWQTAEFSFTTGATFNGNEQGIFFNNWTTAGTLAYIDNWEMYALPDPVITSSAKSLVFDPEHKSAYFTVSSSNLSSDISLTAPAGLTLNKLTVVANAQIDTVKVTWNGTAAIGDTIRLTSGTTVLKIVTKTTLSSNAGCFTALYPNKTNLVKDPYLNNLTNFGGWGTRDLITIAEAPDSVYCGSSSGRVITNGSIDVVLTGLIKPNTTYITRAWVRTIGGSFQLGAFGVDNVNPADIKDTIDTHGNWQQMTLEFTTAQFTAAYGVFFNNYQRTGRRGFIDNWEIYEKDPNAVASVNAMNSKVYLSNNRIVAEFDLDQASDVEIAVYDTRGSLISQHKLHATEGRNVTSVRSVMTDGVYIVKITASGKSTYTKLTH